MEKSSGKSEKSEKSLPPTRKQCINMLLGSCPNGNSCPYDHRSHGMGGAGGGKQTKQTKKNDKTGQDESKNKHKNRHKHNEFQKHPNERKKTKPIDLTITDREINDRMARENEDRMSKLTIEDFKIEDLVETEEICRSKSGIIHSTSCKKAMEGMNKSMTKMTVAKATELGSRLPVLKGGCCRRKLYNLMK